MNALNTSSPLVLATIGLGANLGDAQQHVKDAIAKIAQLPSSTLIKQSALFCSAPIDASGDDFINAVIQIRTQLSAEQLLIALQQIEHHFGRERPYINAPRTLDLDILLFGDVQISNDTLQIPHPRMTTRAFVIMPLLQIDPNITIPGYGSIKQFVPHVMHQTIHQV